MTSKKQFKLLAFLEWHKPVSATDLAKMGLSIKYLGSGAFREVYRLDGYDAVIKFPMQNSSLTASECVEHAQQELDAFTRIRNSRSQLKQYLPKIYYQDYEHGVIVMEKYKSDWVSAYSTSRDRRLSSRAWVLGERIRKFFHIRKIFSDYNGDNLGLDKQGKFRIIDLGVC